MTLLLLEVLFIGSILFLKKCQLALSVVDYTFSINLRCKILVQMVRKKIRKKRLFKNVRAFCEEKVLRYLLGVFWYAEYNVGKLKRASSLSNLHISKKVAKLKKINKKNL